MTQIAWFLLTLMLGAATPHAVAQAAKPGRAIVEAAWAEHRDMYPHSPLCTPDEVTLWACEAGKRAFSLCSSQRVTRKAGHIQYRVRRNGRMAFQYPQSIQPPLGLFAYRSFPNGDASVEFSSHGYHYSLVDPLRSASSIRVSGPAASGTTKIGCGANQTLQVNYTMRLMYESGIWPGY